MFYIFKNSNLLAENSGAVIQKCLRLVYYNYILTFWKDIYSIYPTLRHLSD